MSDSYTTEEGVEFDLSTVIGKTTPKEIWEQKDDWFNKAKDSREVWEKMPDEKREALERMVRGAIERMHDRIPEWLPEALAVEGGQFVDVSMRFLFTDIDKEIDRNEKATSFQIKAATNEALTALKEIAAVEAEEAKEQEEAV